VQPPPSLWWSALAQPLVPRPALGEDLDVDVAIVGGGYTGLWTARELKRRDPELRVAVIEKEVCGFGASGRNGGWASSFYPVSDDGVLARYGEDAYRHLRSSLQLAVRSLGEAIATDGIDAHFIQGGTLTFARSPLQVARLQDHVRAAAALGQSSDDLCWLGEGEARSRGDLAGVLGATYSPHCARIHPALLVRGLAEVNERLGVSIFEHTPVTRIVGRTTTHAPMALTPGGTVRANLIVRATEGFTPTLPGLRRAVAPIYSLMIASAPQSSAFWAKVGLANYETFADDRHLIIYGQRTNDDRIAFGGRGAPYHFGSSVEERYDRSPRVFSLLETTLRELFPALEGDVTHRWGGPLAMPRDFSPSVWVDERRGLASAGGYTGDGVVLSYVAANALADLITDPDTPTSTTTLPFVERQSKKWEIEPLRWIGINAGLGLAARADRAEEGGRQSKASAWLERLLDKPN
jgi:glycine/D-amino acid oxidase-like deaminating enzyme